MSVGTGPKLSGMQKEIQNRRKAAKMLIAVVVLFVICYLPVHLRNIALSFGYGLNTGPYTGALSKFACRFLIYTNSSINPILYNFMCERFQKEFRRVCCCMSVVPRSASITGFQGSTFAPTINRNTTNTGSRGRKPNDDSVCSPLLKQVLKDTHFTGRRGTSMADIAEEVGLDESPIVVVARPRQNSFTNHLPT